MQAMFAFSENNNSKEIRTDAPIIISTYNAINLKDNGTKVLSPEKKQRQHSLCQEERRFLHEKSALQNATQISTIHIHESTKMQLLVLSSKNRDLQNWRGKKYRTEVI